MRIRKSKTTDLAEILHVEHSAFGTEEGPVIVELVEGLLADPSARPLLSLVASDNGEILGHILFTRVHISGHPEVSAVILCPLAVAPQAQARGIGGQLIVEGLRQLKNTGTNLAFVLGYPDYYQRFGFSPAGRLGLDAPYPIADKNADAWMVQFLQPGLTGEVRGQLICADVLSRPEYWVE